METPRDINAVLASLLGSGELEAARETALEPEDEAYLNSLVNAVRAGNRAVIVVEDSDDKLKYMFSNASRAEAISMLGKVIESTGRRLANGDD